jgi:tetratricopeptide (TPR) repeat protein
MILKALAVGFILLVVARASLHSQEQSPAFPYVQNGNRFFDQGKYKEALGEYQKAFSLDPNNNWVKYQIQQIQNKTGMSVGPEEYEILPPRDYSKLTFELGPVYKDVVNNYSIRPPKEWAVDNTDPNFSIKFTEPYSEAFIFVKVIPTKDPVMINYEFRDKMEALTRKLLEQVPASALRYCNFEKFQDDTVLRTEILFKTGPNKSLIGTRYISDINRMVIVSWVCQEKLYFTFRPLLESSISTLNLNPR